MPNIQASFTSTAGGQGAGGPQDVVGPTDGGQCYYHYNNGRFFNGLVTVAFELNDVPPGAGGFACVAGSHKGNFPLPSDWRVSKKQADIPDCVDRVAANAGDAILFTEACAHGTVPWQGSGERRNDLLQVLPPRGGLGPLLLQRRPLRRPHRKPARHPHAPKRLRPPQPNSGDLEEGPGGTGGACSIAEGGGRAAG